MRANGWEPADSWWRALYFAFLAHACLSSSPLAQWALHCLCECCYCLLLFSLCCALLIRSHATLCMPTVFSFCAICRSLCCNVKRKALSVSTDSCSSSGGVPSPAVCEQPISTATCAVF